MAAGTLSDGQSIHVKAIGDGTNYTDSEISEEATYTASTSGGDQGGGETTVDYANYSYTWTEKGSTGNVELNNVNWDISHDSTYAGSIDSSNDKGWQICSGSKSATDFTMETSDLSNFNTIVVNASTANNASATLSVYVDGTLIETKELTNAATNYTFKLNSLSSGTIKIVISQTTSKALYLKSIAVTGSAS